MFRLLVPHSPAVSVLCAAALLPASPAHAQRTAENAATSAQDAFGTSIGGETIGIYSPGFVRGFSALEAGNVRLDGLAIDQQATFTDRLISGLQIRVGLSAQSYPFPAPTGVADYSLRRPGEQRVLSTLLRVGPFGGLGGEADLQLPLAPGLSLGAGAAIAADRNNFGGSPLTLSGALILRWRPADDVELLPFWSRVRVRGDEAQPLYFTDGTGLPPRIPRRRLLGQSWADNEGETGNAGLIARYTPGDWTVQAGLFRSVFDYQRSFAQLRLNVRPGDGVGQEAVIAEPQRRFVSTSGELRISRRIVEGDRLHAVHVSLRGRERRRLYGGGQFIPLGERPIDTVVAVPEPVPAFGPRTRDRVGQLTAGLAYEGRWKGVGELSVGVQRTDYRKSVDAPGGPLPDSTDAPWLLNATLAATLTPALALYAGYTQGLEESPVAPDIALNKDEAPPAIRTRQIDAGLRWSITPGLRLVAGVFEITKPYFNLDRSLQFARLGEIRQRGVEMSLSGQLFPGFTAVAGTIFVDPRVSGRAVDEGLIGARPVSTFRRLNTVVLNYQPPAHPALSVDTVIEASSDRVANSAVTVWIPARALVSVGARYRFTLGPSPSVLRVLVGNAGDVFGWSNGASGFFVPNNPRRLTVSLATDWR